MNTDFVIAELKTHHQASSHKSTTDEIAFQPSTSDTESNAFQERQSHVQDENASATLPSQRDKEQHQDCETSGSTDTPDYTGHFTAAHGIEGSTEVSKDENAGSPTMTDTQPCLISKMSLGKYHQLETTDQDLNSSFPSQAADVKNEKQSPQTIAEVESQEPEGGTSPGHYTLENGFADKGASSMPGQVISTDEASQQKETTPKQERGSTDIQTFSAQGTSHNGYLETRTNDVSAQGISSGEASSQQKITTQQEAGLSNTQTPTVHDTCQNGHVEKAPDQAFVAEASSQQEVTTEQQAGSAPDVGSPSHSEADYGGQGTQEMTAPGGISDQRIAMDSETYEAPADKTSSIQAVSSTADQADENTEMKDDQDEKDTVHTNILVTDGAETGSLLTLECAIGQSEETSQGDAVQSDIPYIPCSNLASDLLRCYLGSDNTDCFLRVNGHTFLAHK